MMYIPSEDDDEADDSESLRWFFPRKFLASNAPPPAPALELLVLSRRDWGNLSNIFLGFKHQSCSGLIQFQRTQGNHKAIPISMVRKTISWVLRLVRLTLKQRIIVVCTDTFPEDIFSGITYFVFQNSSRVSAKRNPVAMIIINAWDKRPSRDWCNWLELTNWVSDIVGCDASLAAGMARWLPWNTSICIQTNLLYSM